MALIEDLNKRFAIEGVAEIIAGNGGLPAVAVKAPNGANGTIYLHGGHVTAWTPEGAAGGEDVLWLSKKSLWQDDKPIRGGVPVCFPWFGPKKDDPAGGGAPAHGTARLRQWDLESIRQNSDGVTVTLATRSDEATRKLWPGDRTLRHRVTFGAQLTMQLEITNTGLTPVHAEEALHSYFSVGDVQRIRITGLDGVNYIDKTDGMKEKTQHGDISISAETDRVYLNTTSTVTIDDPVKGRKITITKENSKATVVWNPWIAKAKAMADFGDEEWPHMICVETCNVGPFALTIDPGESHTMTAKIRVDRA
ncbi:MAG TPA: D-hexose-6-phosphate mutarotase [Phycisphaerae bacterium]|nr:D-hexose-6-phosphate mutarotase [Phycisphaerae bacterium]